MNPTLFPDFRDFLKALNKARVKYLIVGGYSVIIHGYPRSTTDMDVWVERSPKNYSAIQKAFQIFKMPLLDMTAENFLNNNMLDVYTYGRPPVCIDIINFLKDLDFEAAWNSREIKKIQNLKINVIDKKTLLKAKKLAGRYKDLDDLEHLKD